MFRVVNFNFKRFFFRINESKSHYGASSFSDVNKPDASCWMVILCIILRFFCVLTIHKAIEMWSRHESVSRVDQILRGSLLERALIPSRQFHFPLASLMKYLNRAAPHADVEIVRPNREPHSSSKAPATVSLISISSIECARTVCFTSRRRQHYIYGRFEIKLIFDIFPANMFAFMSIERTVWQSSGNFNLAASKINANDW